MISEKELSINNQSYTKKDFASIYPEQVDVIRSLTNRWDPKTSNESDPGVVLVKEASFVGDKLNYNIDKSILETFMPSCTQETSMRQNCESRAYEMEYYNCATTRITFTYAGETLEDDESIVFKAFETVVASQDDSVYYTLVEDITLSKSNPVDSALAYEGELSQLTVASSSDEYKIQLVNLDDNKRIYFPVNNVAQNGVFISNSRGTWERVKNLNVIQPGKPVYKFGFSSKKGLPYVEFPDDIASLIDSGLTINYLTTSGVDGNVSAGYLNSLAKYVAVKNSSTGQEEYSPNMDGDTPDLYIKNESSAINGKNPQTVSEAYETYKKTIGVFDTQVTCRDYESAIYNMYDSDETFPLVSNVHAADRRDDINHGVRYLSFEDNDIIYKNYKIGCDVTAYDLCLYPLSPMYSSTLTDYNQSFIPKLDTSEIEANLENSKCVSHDYKKAGDNDIYAIKNLATLDAKIVTTYKVNSYERAQIIQNVQQALIKNFNAREVDYGYEIPYDTILDVIQNADARISFVSLAEPELTTTYITKNSTIDSAKVYQDTEAGLNYFSVVVARNVLSGKVSLFNFDDRFNYDLGTTTWRILDNLSKVTTNTSIELSTSDTTLRDNEVIQIVGPSLITKVSYLAYVYYWLESSNNIPANENYQLRENEHLHIYTVDSNQNPVLKTYNEGDIIESNLELKPINQSGIQPSGSVTKGDYYYYVLGPQDHIDYKEINRVTIENPTNCYWIRNNKDNALFTVNDETSVTGTYEIILGDNEYFFYTDNGFNTLYTLGSGTTLTTTYAPTQDNNIWSIDRISLEDILENGLLQLKESWKKINFNSNKSLTLQENTIVTLVEGNKIKLDSGDLTLDNTFKELDSGCTYEIDGDEKQLPSYDIGNIKWKIRSRLDIVTSKDKSQKLLSGQSVTFYNKDCTDYESPEADTSLTLLENNMFNLNLATDIAGGTLIDISSIDAENKEIYPLDVFAYQEGSSTNKPDRVKSKYWQMNFDTTTKVIDTSGTPENTGGLLMVYITTDSAVTTCTLQDSEGGTLSLYPSGTASGLAGGMYIVSLPTSNNSAIKVVGTGTGTIVFDVPKMFKPIFFNSDTPGQTLGVNPYNPNLGVEQICMKLKYEEGWNWAQYKAKIDAVFGAIKTYIEAHSDGKFYYSADIESTNVIESDDLSSPYALYDYNNVANRFTITQIDIDNSSVDIVRSSRL